MKRVLQGLKRVIVIPSVADLDEAANERYLGLSAFQHFAPYFSDGTAIGISGGLALQAFLQELDLSRITSLRLFALNCQGSGQPTITTADILLCDLLARHWQTLVAPNAPKPKVNVEPSQLSPDILDFAFVSVQKPDEALRQKGVAAEVLGYRLTHNGLLFDTAPLCPHVRAVPLSFLQKMVQKGKWVVALAADAEALLAIYRARRVGGLLFNALVTDDRCATAVLRQMASRHRLADIPQRQQWWAISQRFRVAHLRYGDSKGHFSNKAIAKRLHLSRKQVPKLLDEAMQGDCDKSPLVQLKVKPPSFEHELELALLENWKLKEVWVVPTFNDDEQGYAALGEAAKEFFWQLAEDKENFCVGISWGRSLLAMVEALALTEMTKRLTALKKLTFVALVHIPPAHSPLLLGTAPSSLLGTLLLRFNASPKTLPFSVSCKTFRSNEPAPVLDAVFTGIGIFGKGKLIEAYSRELGLKIETRKWQGEMLFQFFDRKGRLLPDRWSGKVQALPLTELRRMVMEGKPVVIVARGEQKAQAVRAAYRAQLFNCLVVDRSLARALLASAPPW
ncbi:MAG: sugar-binding domain-containing protein [Armatimonadota bacterium]